MRSLAPLPSAYKRKFQKASNAGGPIFTAATAAVALYPVNLAFFLLQPLTTA